MGSGSKPIASPKGENGMIIPMAMIKTVRPVTCQEARLWMKGIFLVRIMCTIRVWDNSPSMNQPD